MNHDRAKRLAIAIIKIKLREASPAEREMLFAWLDEREENRLLYKRITRGEGLAEHFKLEEEFLRSMDLDRITGQITRKLIRQQRTHAFRRTGKIAAAACLAGIIVASALLLAPPSSPVPLAAEITRVESSRVKLILPSGDEMNLEAEEPRELTLATTLLSSDAGGLSLHEQAGTATEVPVKETPAGTMSCRVVTSAGGQYHVLLPDGTEAWINAASELEFPVAFAADRRVVRLKGEAFFNVASLPDRPFIVETRDVATRALGTSFNVHAYEEDETVAVTLLTGRVEVSVTSAETSLQLLPGMAAFWTRATGLLESKEARVGDAIAWRNGLFIFTGEELGQVTRTLARWHGVRFLYSDTEVASHLFTGRINMEETLDSVLESITIAGGPKFRVAGEVVYVLK
jgi:ferric-dicitrate binding protein FerR (iron transport regulator)